MKFIKLLFILGKLEFMLAYRNIIKTVKEAAKCRQFLVSYFRFFLDKCLFKIKVHLLLYLHLVTIFEIIY